MLRHEFSQAKLLQAIRVTRKKRSGLGADLARRRRQRSHSHEETAYGESTGSDMRAAAMLSGCGAFVPI